MKLTLKCDKCGAIDTAEYIEEKEAELARCQRTLTNAQAERDQWHALACEAAMLVQDAKERERLLAQLKKP